MDILHVNSNYLTSKLHENLLDNMVEKNVNHTIFMPMKKETISNLKFQSKYNMINPIAFKNRDKFFFHYKQKKIMDTLERNVTLDSFDLIHAHTLFTDGNIAYQLKKEYNIPYVITVRGDTDVESFFKYRINLRNLGRKILRNAEKICFLSPAHRDKMLENYIQDKNLITHIKNNSIILPNGIDNFWFNNEFTNREKPKSEPIKIISVGLINKRKNHITSVKAIRIFEEKFKLNAELMIVGKVDDSKYADSIRSMAGSNISLSGPVNQKTLIDLYRESHVFLLPSSRETFGLVYPEAMSQGLPILYTKGQGIDGYFENGQVGFHVINDSPEDIADKIYQVIKNYEELSSNALLAFRQFDWEKISMLLLEVYRKAL